MKDFKFRMLATLALCLCFLVFTASAAVPAAKSNANVAAKATPATSVGAIDLANAEIRVNAQNSTAWSDAIGLNNLTAAETVDLVREVPSNMPISGYTRARGPNTKNPRNTPERTARSGSFD